MKKLITIILMLMTMGYAGFAFGAVSAEEANKLDGPVLTPMGAERAGNKDGTIPAWTGVPIPIPKGFKPGSGVYVDPFADEKPLFSINAKNMNQYTDKLAEGVKIMMKKYPDYRIDVYKTYRTLVFPPYVNDSTKKNATVCQATKGGEAVTGKGCHGGIPFPLTKSGIEAMWNVQLAFQAPETYTSDLEGYNITSTGKVSLSVSTLLTVYQPWQDPNKEDDWRYMNMHSRYSGPPRRSGEIILSFQPLDYFDKGSVIWQYLPGQRRVRLAPDLCCDTPNSATAGASVYDDIYIFNGRMDRYNWKLIGKKELYIPYNAYKFAYYRGDVNKALLARYVNPDLVRWELRRVWVVEATLKPDKRHVYSKRIFYADEDYLKFQIADNFDKRGVLYRMTIGHPIYIYDRQGMWQDFHAFYDVISNSYAVNFWPRGHRGIQYPPAPSQSYFSPDSLAGGGLR